VRVIAGEIDEKWSAIVRSCGKRASCTTQQSYACED
jgi:hypothetical protein